MCGVYGDGRTGRPWRWGLLATGVILAAVELHGHLPSPASTWTALRQTRPGWLSAAVVLQVVSMAAFAEQQRRLLFAFGVRMPAPASLAVSYTRSAMSTALPGGSAVSAGYAFRQFRVRGASQPIAAAVTLLSAVASVAGLALLYAGAALVWTAQSGRTPVVLAAVVAAVVAVVVAVVGWPARRYRPIRVPAATRPESAAESRPARLKSRPARLQSRPARLKQSVRETAVLARAVAGRHWLGVLAVAAFNWSTDLACLIAALHAIGLTVPTRAVALAYLAAQLIRQIPVTPGGIGMIEASLVLALTTAGAATAPAAAAVLFYRLLSCWSILPIGLICWTVQNSPAAAAALRTSAESH